MTSRHHAVEITEMADGWLLAWSASEVKFAPTAIEALTAVRTRDRTLVEADVCDLCMTTITWAPCTRAGRVVVAAITAADFPA